MWIMPICFIEALGCRPVDELSICWLRLYLKGRILVTDVDGTMYAAKGIICGVPQGYMQFLLYINDMSAAANCCTRTIQSCLPQKRT